MGAQTRKVFILLGFLGCLAGVVLLWNHLSLQAPLNQVIATDPRNEGFGIRVHYGRYFQPSVLVFDLRKISGQKSPADLFRIFLQFAAEVQESDFKEVRLAYNGRTKFILPGEHFRLIGREYGVQNPVYTIRTFPEHLLLPNGERAYEAWTGGWLGVASRQIDDFNDFHRRWYLEEILSPP